MSDGGQVDCTIQQLPGIVAICVLSAWIWGAQLMQGG